MITRRRNPAPLFDFYYAAVFPATQLLPSCWCGLLLWRAFPTAQAVRTPALTSTGPHACCPLCPCVACMCAEDSKGKQLVGNPASNRAESGRAFVKRWTAAAVGKYEYVCPPHALGGMKGKLNVIAAPMVGGPCVTLHGCCEDKKTARADSDGSNCEEKQQEDDCKRFGAQHTANVRCAAGRSHVSAHAPAPPGP